MVGGYMGKFLFVNLSNESISEIPLNYTLAREFLGGYGIASRLIYEMQKPGVDPLGEEAYLAIITGPLTGTPLPFVSRFTVAGKSPLTNSWGDANARGYFGPYLKFSGFDGVFFKGISKRPVYLLIDNGKATICDASEIWGKDTYATEDYLKTKYGKNAYVACIGPAGEKLTKIAGVITSKGKAAARSGLGAVMGSKKLKAVVVRGELQVPLANPIMVENLRKKYIKQAKDGVGFAKMYSTTGTPGYIEAGAINGDSPVKNWFGVGIKDLKDISEYKYENIAKYIVRRGTCYKCIMGDWKYVMIESGPYSLKEETHMPEYETASAFGSYLCNTNFESIIMCNDICNRYGLDTISTGATIAFAMMCFEAGILTKSDTEGIELNFGNHQAIVEITLKIAKREGIGEILADGVKNAAEKIGKGSEKFAIHVGGQELPAHDPRFEPSMASIYRNEPTPGRHGQASQYCVPTKLAELMPDIDFSFSFGNKRNIMHGRGKAQKVLSCLNHCVQSLGCCLWGYLSTEVTFMPECLSAVTGWDVDLNELVTTGERIGNMRLAFALREGVNPVKWNFPKVALGDPPLKEGPTAGITVDLDLLTKEFFGEMEWDPETSKPSKKKFEELNLGWLIKDLYGEE